MKHLNLSTACLAVCFILVTGCKKDIPEKVDTQTLKGSQIAGRPSTELSVESMSKVSKIRSSLPANYRIRLEKANKQLLIKYPEYRNVARKALAAEPSTCEPTTLNHWLNSQIADWDGDAIFFALYTGILDFPATDALLFENSSSNQYFGPKGEYSQQIIKSFKDIKRFYSIQGDRIVLAAMHGSMLQDRERLIKADMAIYGDDRITAEYFADLILTLLKEVPQYRNGNHPIFTFNAFAQPSIFIPTLGEIPGKIIMGDGILEGFAGIGFKDVAPQAILAHEFGHQVQFHLDLFDGAGTPESNRTNELMADAYSAYYLSHSRGASMQWKRVQQFLKVFFNIGDCAVASAGHHGTPAQRMAAARWAYALASDAQKQGQILTAKQFSALFKSAMPSMVTQ